MALLEMLRTTGRHTNGFPRHPIIHVHSPCTTMTTLAPGSDIRKTDPKPVVKAKANIKKNRLHVTISGNIDSKSLEKLYTEVRFCVADLKKGFEVISDISQCNLLYISGLPIYKKIIDYLIANNVGEIVRVIKNDNISFKQIVNFSDKIQSIKPIYVANKEEAEVKLEQCIKRDGIRFHLNNLLLQYEFNDAVGNGIVVDISVSGCAVESSSIPLAADDLINLVITFDPHDTLVSDFQLKARVVRVTDKHFAAQFLDLDEGQKEQLYKRLAYEVSRVSFML